MDVTKQWNVQLCRSCRDAIAYQPQKLHDTDELEECGRIAWSDVIQRKDTCHLCRANYRAYFERIGIDIRIPDTILEPIPDPTPEAGKSPAQEIDPDLSYFSVEKRVDRDGLHLLRFSMTAVRPRREHVRLVHYHMNAILAKGTPGKGLSSENFPWREYKLTIVPRAREDGRVVESGA